MAAGITSRECGAWSLKPPNSRLPTLHHRAAPRSGSRRAPQRPWKPWPIVTVLLGLVLFPGCGRVPRTSGPLPQDAYVWQRDWNTNVSTAVANLGPRFRELAVLGAEITWRDGQPRVTRVPFRAAPVAAPDRRVGLALRIGPFSGPFRTNDAIARTLRETAQSMVEECRRQGTTPAELQLDFDCAESRLDGYRVWVRELRRELAPIPLVITALPSWLKRATFGELARAADGFVLQVHSVARPRSPDEPFQLCDPDAALRWVEQAGRLGVPFRVALPTYGYLVAFGPDGRFLGASAEGAPPERPVGTTLGEWFADPTAMARLVAIWNADRPAPMMGLIWYRLPVPGDRLNWRWPTLESVMRGEVPRPRLEADFTAPQPGLIELRLRNTGTADHAGPVGVRVRWDSAAAVGHDGIRGFAAEPDRPGGMLFTNPICRLPAGDAIPIGWLRLDRAVSPSLEVVPPARRPE